MKKRIISAKFSDGSETGFESWESLWLDEDTRDALLQGANASLLEMPSIVNETFMDRVVTLANKGHSNELDEALRVLEDKYGIL